MEKMNKAVIWVAVALFVVIVLVISGFGIARYMQVKNESKPEAIAAKMDEAKTSYQAATTGVKTGQQGYLKPDERDALYKETVTALQGVVKYQPDNADAWLKLAVSYYNLKQLDQAIDAYQKLLETKPANEAVIHNNMANVYRDKDPADYTSAETQYKKAIELNPTLIVAYTNLSLMLRDRENKPADAITVLEDGLAKNANSIDIMDTLANSYKMANQEDKANALYNKILELDPNNANAKKALGK